MANETPNEEFGDWSRERKLSPNSSTTRQLYENRDLTVQEYIGRFRKGSINAILRRRNKGDVCRRSPKNRQSWEYQHS